jgi:hypothetical protein
MDIVIPFHTHGDNNVNMILNHTFYFYFFKIPSLRDPVNLLQIAYRFFFFFFMRDYDDWIAKH